MPSLKLLRAGQQILNKIKPDIPTPLGNAANYLLNPVKEPQRAYAWEIRFLDSTGSGQSVQYYAKNVSIPAVSNEIISRYHQGTEYFYTGRDTSPKTFTATFWDNQSLETYHYFLNWVKRINGVEGFSRLKATPRNQIQDIEIILKDSSDLLETKRTKFTGCVISDISEVQMSYSDSAEFTFDVTFKYVGRYG